MLVVGGQIELGKFAGSVVAVFVAFQREGTGNGIKSGTGIDREVNRQDSGAEFIFQIGDDGIELRIFAVEFADKEQARQFVFSSHFKGLRMADIMSLAAIHDKHRHVNGAHSGDNFSDKIREARGIDNIEDAIFVSRTKETCRD